MQKNIKIFETNSHKSYEILQRIYMRHYMTSHEVLHDFMLMISQIPQMCLNSFFFADDTSILYSHPTIENQINRINEELKEVL